MAIFLSEKIILSDIKNSMFIGKGQNTTTFPCKCGRIFSSKYHLTRHKTTTCPLEIAKIQYQYIYVSVKVFSPPKK